MNPRSCYWSVCDGAYTAMMEHGVASARRAGVFKEFHVMTDRPIEPVYDLAFGLARFLRRAGVRARVRKLIEEQRGGGS